MNSRCPDPLELDLILLLPESDPRRHHVQECPQCRGIVAAMESFLAPGDTLDLEDLATADSELSRRMEGSLLKRRSHAPWMRRSALTLAAVLALLAVGLTATDVLQIDSADPVRPGQHQRGPALPDAVSISAGAAGLELDWPAAPPSDEIAYLFFSADMTEVARLTTPGPLLVGRDELPANAEYCQALALTEGDVIARSSVRRLSPDPE